MDPHSFIARAEAQRWLGIAEKLLMNRDLVGSKTFAIRAKESDPRLELADQILAITDTLMAADKRVGANNNQPDWYSILQLVQLTHDSELIVNQYRRLALLLNPSQTQLPYADQAFQLVSEAWSVLSNPMRKSIYDNELNFSQQQQQQFNTIRFTHEVPPPQQQHQYQQPAPPPQRQQQQQHQHNFFSPHNVVGTSREQERPERPFVIRPHQQHNFLSQHTLSGSDYEQEQPTRPSFQSQPTQQQQHYQQQQQQQRQQPQVQQRQPPPPQPQPQIQSHPIPQIQSHPQPPPPPAPPQPPPQQPTPPPQQPTPPPQQPTPPPQQPTPPPQQPTPPPQQPTPPPQQPTPPPQQPTPTPQQPMPPPQQQPPERNTSTPVRQENSNGVREDRGTDGRNEDGSSTFWTACPFCFYMYEYLKVYAECTLRCQNCKRAFQAVEVQSPPLISEGKEAHYHCWGFFPLGISKSSFEKNKGNGSGWSPFSAMFAGPKFKDFQDNVKPKRNYYKGPRLYIDDVVDDVFAGISEPSDDSDFGWRSTRKKKKAKTVKSGTRKKGSGRKKKQALGVNMAHSVNMGNGENVGEGFPVQEDVLVPNVPVVETSKKTETNKKAETSKKAVGTVPRRQSGRVVKELGKLDLNVEFNNNDGEEPAPGMTAGNRGGHREEDNIEGIGFFEGLDEFLSSLPILSVVGDDKVKAA